MTKALMLRKKAERKKKILLWVLKFGLVLAVAAGMILFLRQMYVEEEKETLACQELNMRGLILISPNATSRHETISLSAYHR